MQVIIALLIRLPAALILAVLLKLVLFFRPILPRRFILYWAEEAEKESEYLKDILRKHFPE